MSKKKVAKRILIIDGQNWAHRAFHAQSGLMFNGKKIGLVYGFINMINSLLVRFPKPKKIFVTFDHGRNQNRLDILPNYKLRDKKIDFDRESFEEQIGAIRKILVYMGIPVLYNKMTEADDYIAQLTFKYRDKYKILIASGDKDFRQLVGPNVSISDDKHGRITTKNFESIFGIKPEQYAEFLMLWGDTSDNIPGVRGIGEKTAIKILQEYGNLATYHTKSIDTVKRRESIEIEERNRCLIDLEYFISKYGEQELVFFKDKKKPKFHEERYLKMCQLYGLKKFRQPEFIQSLKRNIGR